MRRTGLHIDHVLVELDRLDGSALVLVELLRVDTGRAEHGLPLLRQTLHIGRAKATARTH